MIYRRIIQITFITLVILILGVSPVMAAKPDGLDGTRDVIAISNGFPSGEHFNLNIHGKKADYIGDPTPGGNSVFILEYGNSTIEYVTNKKSSLTELYVLDPLAEAFDGDPAKVQMPYEADGYYVYGRILAKPNNGNIEPVSSIILYPNQVVAAYNGTDPANPDFPNYTGDEDSLLALGLIVGPNLYTAEPSSPPVTESTTPPQLSPQLMASKGFLKIFVADAPPQRDVSEINVILSNIEVSKYVEGEDEDTWISVVKKGKTFDLIKLRDTSMEALLGESTLETGQYLQIRMDVEIVDAVIDGERVDVGVTLPGGKLKMVASFEIREDKTTVVTIDFDADKSLVFTGEGKVMFKPVVTLIVAYE